MTDGVYCILKLEERGDTRPNPKYFLRSNKAYRRTATSRYGGCPARRGHILTQSSNKAPILEQKLRRSLKEPWLARLSWRRCVPLSFTLSRHNLENYIHQRTRYNRCWLRPWRARVDHGAQHAAGPRTADADPDGAGDEGHDPTCGDEERRQSG